MWYETVEKVGGVPRRGVSCKRAVSEPKKCRMSFSPAYGLLSAVGKGVQALREGEV